tara:strand:+ start:5052 stop:5258 length:207 start_codon:yes stop_codon:yes gene_type:complete
MSKETLTQEFKRMREQHPEMNHPLFRDLMQAWMKNHPGEATTIQEVYDAVHPRWVRFADALDSHEGGE